MRHLDTVSFKNQRKHTPLVLMYRENSGAKKRILLALPARIQYPL
jgi:hypothetical protein